MVLTGKLEDVCVLAIASDLLTTGRSLVVSQDLIVDINHENNISGITTDDRGRWRYLASQAGSSGFKGGLTFFTKKRAAQNLAAVVYKPITVTKSIGYYRLLF